MMAVGWVASRVVASIGNMNIAYADPPYPGCAHLYAHDVFYDGQAEEVDHAELIERLERDYDGWVLHTHVPGMRMLEREGLIPAAARIMAWVKPFAAFKRNVSVAWSWEPIIVNAARKPVVEGATVVMRDHFACAPDLPEWVSCPITLRKGLTGAKPENVCRYAFEVAAAHPHDTLEDLYPGTGAVTRAWERWCSERPLWEAVEV